MDLPDGSDRPNNMESESLGILSKTIIRSPVVRWILHAQIRHSTLNDVVFVGDDFIRVNEVEEEGNLKHVATKADFDSRIRAAKVFSIDADQLDEDLLIKAEVTDVVRNDSSASPQLVVLTLQSNDLVFVCMTSNADGRLRFVQQICPMPTFDRTLFQPGEHLAVEPYSRALAVAANEREVVIYSAKSRDRIHHELRTNCDDWCPVSSQRPLQVEGVIHHMEFLIPPVDDGDHVILLLIVINERMIRAISIDWYHTSDLHHAEIHPGQPLDSASCVPSLLIPLRNASFLLITGNQMKRWKDILSGCVSGITLSPLETPSAYPGISSKKPIWTSWCRPRRTLTSRRLNDHLYLVSEEGLVFSVQCTADDRLHSSYAGDLEGHVGSAFASLGNCNRGPDILATAGDMSSGRLVSIGHPATAGRVSELSWSDTMDMDLIETIPNWASVTDIITALPRNSHGRLTQVKESLFVTSGSQPYGSVTELRQGLDARLSMFFELDGLRSVTGVWALPIVASGSLVILLASPAGTRLLYIPGCDFQQIEEPGASESLALDTMHRTLAASTMLDSHIIQVTECSISITAGLSLNFEDSFKRTCKDDETILAATIEPARSMIITAERRQGMFFLSFLHYSERLLNMDEFPRLLPAKVDYEPLALAVAAYEFGIVVAVATTTADLHFFLVGDTGHPQAASQMHLPISEDTQTLCDNLVMLRGVKSCRMLLICGLRDGKICIVPLNVGNSKGMELERASVIQVGFSTVKLTAFGLDGLTAVAVSGIDTCLLSWDGQNATTFRINRVWVSDKLRPELPQPLVVACNIMPSAELLPSDEFGEALILVGADEFMVASLETSASVVPRRIPVSGTPNRLLYAKQQRCFVCASLCTEVRSAESSTRGEQRRSIWPVIDFISSRSNVPTFTYNLQPGQRVYALLEWSFKVGEDKVYSFILVAGSYMRQSGSPRGKITFLQPINKSWDIVDVKEGKNSYFDAPVCALALYDDLTYVACSGQLVLLQRFSVQERKWSLLCEPLKLASAGVFVTVSALLIYVSTVGDSLMVLQLARVRTGNGTDFRLMPFSMAPRADLSLSHLNLQGISATKEVDVTLMSTKRGQIVGMRSPKPSVDAPTQSNALSVSFEARLPRSLTRLKQCDSRPLWKAASSCDVLVDNIIGSAADGTLYGVALLSKSLWKRLSWLQRLCEWSEELSPLSFNSPAYAVAEHGFSGDERAMPIGFSRGAAASEIVMRAPAYRLLDKHINADVLARILDHGGAEKLRLIIRQTAERHDRAGAWMRDHLEEELNAVDEIVEILHGLLDCWM